MNCNCLCIRNHSKTMGICTAEAVTTLRFNTGAMGLINVAMCRACADATETKGKEAPS